MTRNYSVKFKNKSKMLKTPEAVEAAKQEILADTAAEEVVITEEGQHIAIEAKEEDFPAIMNMVVNVFRKLDDKSEVSFQFTFE